MRVKDIGHLLLQLVLLTTLTGHDAGPHRQPPAPTVHWHFDETHLMRTGERCVAVAVPQAGRYWLLLRTHQPSAAPALLVLGEAGDPRTLQRIEATLLEAETAGEHLVCLTARQPQETMEIYVLPAGDPLEVEVEIDPLRTACHAIARIGDLGRQIEMEPDL